MDKLTLNDVKTCLAALRCIYNDDANKDDFDYFYEIEFDGNKEFDKYWNLENVIEKLLILWEKLDV